MHLNPPSSLESLRWHWQHLMQYDPRPALAQLRVPMLALYGGLDRVVPADRNRARLVAAVAGAPARDVTITTIEKANHHFLAAGTGGPGEVPSLRGFAPDYFATRVSWLRARVAAADATAIADADLSSAAVAHVSAFASRPASDSVNPSDALFELGADAPGRAPGAFEHPPR